MFEPLTSEEFAAALGKKGPLLAWAIINDVSSKTGVSTDDLIGPIRTQPTSIARQIAMWKMGKAGLSRRHIGEILGGRDQSTITHGIRQIEAKTTTAGVLAQMETKND